MLQAIAEFASFVVLTRRVFLRKKEVSIEDGKVLVVGFAFWVCLIAAIYVGYPYIASLGA